MRLIYREDKATQAACILMQLHSGRMNHMKLIKLLYLSDRKALVNWGRPITFDWYFSLKHGPVLSFTLDMINSDADPEEPSYWHRYISERVGNEVTLLGEVPKDQLSAAEEELLNDIFAKYGRLNQWQLRDLTHDLPEWRDPQGSCLPINIRDILLSEGMDEGDIREIEEALQAEESADEILS